MKETNHPILTLREAANYLRLSEMTVLKLANQGVLPGAKIGRQWRFTRDGIMNVVKHPEILARLETLK